MGDMMVRHFERWVENQANRGVWSSLAIPPGMWSRDEDQDLCRKPRRRLENLDNKKDPWLGTELPVMGLVWAIMLKFMKLDDGEDDGTKPVAFSDALKMWIQNQVQSYGSHCAPMNDIELIF